ncbi:MAG TPA: 16S rRNA pseudouridine(516) synthase [Lachnospiraceae bacterium]|nr:16S rRNA pseudouridine(516) synthase [Lachnospiraceae bacterium]
MVYLMLNKPQGVLSVTEDRRARTVLDLIAQPYARKLFPAGRLDKDTEGLLLLTNDGMLVHKLISPSRHVWKIYFAVVDGEMTKTHEDAFLGGIEIGEKHPTLPAVMRRLSIDGDFLWRMESERGEGAAQSEPERLPSGLTRRMRQICSESLTLGDYSRCGEGQSLCAVALREGKFHQVKRMFEAVGGKVVFLKRLAMGSLTLDRDLAPGAFRPLTARELRELEEETKTVRLEEP